MKASRRALILGGAILVAAFRWSLCVYAPDLIHPVDPAELDLLWLTQAAGKGTLSWASLQQMLRSADVLHHGGFLPVSLTVWLMSKLLGSLGLPAGYAAIKASAVLWSTLAWLAWTELAHRLGGGRAALLAGVALALPVPWATQWWLTGWGSHPESSVLVACLLLAWRVRPLYLGVLAGLTAAFAPVLTPTALLITILRRHRLAVFGAVVGWLSLHPGLAASLDSSLTEDPSQTALSLVAHALSPAAALASLRAHLGVPLVASSAAPAWLSVPLGLLLVVAAARLLSLRQDARTRLLVVLPLVHLCSVALLSPFRPVVQHRYLLPWLPSVLLWPAIAAGLERSTVCALGWGLVALLPTLFALPVYHQALTRDLPADLFDTHPRAYQALDLDRAPLALVPELERFRTARTSTARKRAATGGFGAAWSRRWGYPVMGEPFSALGLQPGLRGHLQALIRAGQPAQAVAEDAGWGAAVVCGWDPEQTLLALAYLEDLRDPALAGVGQSLQGRADAAAFIARVQELDPQAAAVLRGANSAR